MANKAGKNGGTQARKVWRDPPAKRLGRRHQAASEWREAPNLFCRRWDPLFSPAFFYCFFDEFQFFVKKSLDKRIFLL